MPRYNLCADIVPVRPKSGVGCAHGKAILVGEHAVLRGQPAIAVPRAQIGVLVRVERHATPPSAPSSVRYVDTGTGEGARMGAGAFEQLRLGVICKELAIPERGLRIAIGNGIPCGPRLGSSAAVAAALVQALADSHGRLLGHEEQLRLISIVEASAHGRASGVDAEAVSTASDRVLWFGHGRARALAVAPGCGAVLVVADSGQSSSTADTVRAVAALADQHPTSTQHTMDKIGAIVRRCADLLAVNDIAGLGLGLSENHSLPCNPNPSTPAVDHMVAAAMTAGAAGAKMSGGGGCIVAVCASERVAKNVRRSLLSTGASQCWTQPIHPVGVGS